MILLHDILLFWFWLTHATLARMGRLGERAFRLPSATGMPTAAPRIEASRIGEA
jgi:hypothetical protein